MDIDDYDIHSSLVEKFITKCDKNAFRKMLNMNLNSANAKQEKQKENFLKRQQFLKSMRTKAPQHPYFNIENNYLKNYNTYKKDEISNFRLDLHNFIRDPEYQNKCMKGNYKWATLRFQQMKVNLAKRKGIPVEDLKMPKIWTNKKHFNMEMNGNEIKKSNTNENNSFKKNYTKNIKETAKSNYLYKKYNKAFKLKKNLKGMTPKAGKTISIFNRNS